MLWQIILASAASSFLGMTGGALLLFKERFAKTISLGFVSFAVGSLLGVAFLELIPEALEETPVQGVFWAVIFGIVGFFVLERILRIYHCHGGGECNSHVLSGTVILGDTAHNFIDGVAIAGAFLAGGAPAGIATTLAVLFHEIPQEVGDFGVLLHSGYRRRQILVFSFLSGLAALAGALLGFFLFSEVVGIVGYAAAVASGAFIYIAAADLIPEVHQRSSMRGFWHVALILAGIFVVWGAGILVPE